MTDQHVSRLGSLQRAFIVLQGLEPKAARAKLLAPDVNGVSIFSGLVAQVQGQISAGPSAIDLLGANPESPYIPNRVVGVAPAQLEQREL
jgi:hypothetical protein